MKLSKFLPAFKDLVKVKVEQFHHANQFVIYYTHKSGLKVVAFQSYDSQVAYYIPSLQIMYVNLDKYDYSRTTKHFKMFVEERTPFNFQNSKHFYGVVEKNPNLDWFRDNEI